MRPAEGTNEGSRPGVFVAAIFNPPLSLSSRRGRRVVHKADEAVSVEGTAKALVAGRVGDSPRVPEAGAKARSGTVWGSLDG